MKNKKYAIAPNVQLFISIAVFAINCILFLIAGEVSIYGMILAVLNNLYYLAISFYEIHGDIANTDYPNKDNKILAGGYNPYASINWMMSSAFGLFDCIFLSLYSGTFFDQIPRSITMVSQIIFHIIVLILFQNKFQDKVIRGKVRREMQLLFVFFVLAIVLFRLGINFYGMSFFSLVNIYYGFAQVKVLYIATKNLLTEENLENYRMKADIESIFGISTNVFSLAFSGKFWLIPATIIRVLLLVAKLRIAIFVRKKKVNE